MGVLALVGALAAWPSIAVAAPPEILRFSSDNRGLIYELAFMAGAVGIVLATASRKRLDGLIEISACRPGPLLDAWVTGASGLLFAGAALLPAFALGHASDIPFARFLPLQAVAAAWSALAMRLFPAVEPAAWSVAVGTALLPAILPTGHLLLREAAALAALVLGAALVDHPPSRKR
jgi:hypothetical protein